MFSLNFSYIVCIWYHALNLCLTTVFCGWLFQTHFAKTRFMCPASLLMLWLRLHILDVFHRLYICYYFPHNSLSLFLAYWKFSSITLSMILNPHFIDIFISLIYDLISFIAFSSIYPLVCFLNPHLCDNDIVKKLCSQSYW
jgi:hypothetical protein